VFSSTASRRLLAVAAAAAVLGCGGSATDTGAFGGPSGITGSYAGTLSTAGLCGSGNLAATLFQNGTSVSGLWTTTGFSTTPPCDLNRGGILTGVVFAQSVTLTLVKDGAAFTLNGTTGGGFINGSFTQTFSTGAGVSTEGAFSLARQ